MSSSIASLTNSCVALFGSLTQDPRTHAKEATWIDEQRMLLNMWAVQVGAQARGRSSIDHRLRRNPTVTASIVRLMEILQDNLQSSIMDHADVREHS